MNRVENVVRALEEESLDAIVLYNDKNRLYLTGFHSTAGAVLITKDEAFFITDMRYIEAANDIITGYTVRMSTGTRRDRDIIAEIISQRGIKKVGFEEEQISFSEFNKLSEAFGAELVAAEGIISKLRASKDEEEVECIKRAQRITEEVFYEMLTFIEPGMTERQVAAEIVYRQLQGGADAMSFDPIVVSGVRSSMPHGVPTDNKIQRGDFVTMDFGCVKDGYCSDMTRTIAVGGATMEMRGVYNTVLQAQLDGIKAARAGVAGKQIDAAARNTIIEAGYGDYFGHGFGHSIGLEVHEGPNANTIEEREMPLGAVISAEPGIYIPGKFGVRIEDLLWLRENDAVNLTECPKQLVVI